MLCSVVKHLESDDSTKEAGRNVLYNRTEYSKYLLVKYTDKNDYSEELGKINR